MAYMSHTHVTAVRKPDMRLCVKGILRCQPNIKAEARCKLSRLLICCASPRPPGGGGCEINVDFFVLIARSRYSALCQPNLFNVLARCLIARSSLLRLIRVQ